MEIREYRFLFVFYGQRVNRSAAFYRYCIAKITFSGRIILAVGIVYGRKNVVSS